MKINFIRDPKSHKGHFGHVLILAGSRGMVGAAYLATAAALRAGSGKVTLGTTQDVYTILGTSLPEALTLILKSTSRGSLSHASMRPVLKYAKKVNVVAMGPGLSTHPSTRKLVQDLLQKLKCQVVIDADAINCLQGNPSLLKKTQKPVILTPHEGEFKTLFSRSEVGDAKGRKSVAKRIANKYHCILVRKGNRTLVADPDGSVYENSTGNPGMASGGTGDVLTGMIAGFVAQGFDPVFSARLGAYLHGKAGDLCAKRRGQAALVASDLLDALPLVLKHLESCKDLRKRIPG